MACRLLLHRLPHRSVPLSSTIMLTAGLVRGGDSQAARSEWGNPGRAWPLEQRWNTCSTVWRLILGGERVAALAPVLDEVKGEAIAEGAQKQHLPTERRGEVP
ncbi:hypothetical protein ACP70R_026138 [Stipagrostis hirtigluma subsp. patula]